MVRVGAARPRKREVRVNEIKRKKDVLINAEKACNFPEVARLFRVIDSDTVPAVVEDALRKKIEGGQAVSRPELQEGSVQVFRNRVKKLGLPEFDNMPELYNWNLGYNSFLGYMGGLLK